MHRTSTTPSPSFVQNATACLSRVFAFLDEREEETTGESVQSLEKVAGRFDFEKVDFSYLPDKPCVSQESADSLLVRIKVLKQQDPQCFIIVSLHWGGEHTLKPIPLQRQQAHDLIDAGADALICHHTHTLQTIEQYQGKSIYYSIGNFIFDQHKPHNTRACMVKVSVTKDDAHFETIPIIINNCIPEEGGTRREERGVRSEEGGATFVLRPLTFVLRPLTFVL